MGITTRICTYNMGAGVAEYEALIAGKRCENIPEDKVNGSTFFGELAKVQEDRKANEEAYAIVQETTAERLITSAYDVFCLQEVGVKNRPLLRQLETRNYTIINVSSAKTRGPASGAAEPFFDTAIALSNTRYDIIENLSRNITFSFAGRNGDTEDTKDVAIVLAYDKLQQKNVAFVSAHIPGFSFDTQSKTILEAQQKAGDALGREIIRAMSTISNCDLKFIGADMNGNLTISPNRFNILQRGGFTTCSTGKTTNLDPMSQLPANLKKEIDFIFVSLPSVFRIINWVKSFFITTFKHHIETLPSADITFDPSINASDHIPVITTHRVVPVPSKLARLCNCIARIFRRCA